MLRKGRTFTVAANQELWWLAYFLRLQLAVRNTGISDREWPNAIQNMFLRADMRGDKFRYDDGEPFAVPLVDDVWKGNDRYVRQFLAFEECKYPDRDRLIDLFFRVEMPDIARHFGR